MRNIVPESVFLTKYFAGCKHGHSHAQIAESLKMKQQSYAQRLMKVKEKWKFYFRRNGMKWPTPPRAKIRTDVTDFAQVKEIFSKSGL